MPPVLSGFDTVTPGNGVPLISMKAHTSKAEALEGAASRARRMDPRRKVRTRISMMDLLSAAGALACGALSFGILILEERARAPL
jgi:hypothetical protein